MTRLTAAFVAAAVVLSAALILGRPTPPVAEPPDLPDGVPGAPGVDVPRARSVAQKRLAREVADGHRPLLEAAALFGELNRLQPAVEAPVPGRGPGPHLPTPFPGATEQERLCRQVAIFAYNGLRDESPGRAAEVLARLEAEVREEVRVRGAVRLPATARPETVPRLIHQGNAESPRSIPPPR